MDDLDNDDVETTTTANRTEYVAREEIPRYQYEIEHETWWQSNSRRLFFITVAVLVSAIAFQLFRQPLTMKDIVDCKRIEGALNNATRDGVVGYFKREPDQIITQPSTVFRYYTANMDYKVWDSYYDKMATAVDVRFDSDGTVLAFDYQH